VVAGCWFVLLWGVLPWLRRGADRDPAGDT